MVIGAGQLKREAKCEIRVATLPLYSDANASPIVDLSMV